MCHDRLAVVYYDDLRIEAVGMAIETFSALAWMLLRYTVNTENIVVVVVVGRGKSIFELSDVFGWTAAASYNDDDYIESMTIYAR